jgi:hypothetical protein
MQVPLQAFDRCVQGSIANVVSIDCRCRQGFWIGSMLTLYKKLRVTELA